MQDRYYYRQKILCRESVFEPIYADTDAVFIKKKDATRKDYEEIMNKLINETGLGMTLDFHYKFLVLLYIESDEKMEVNKYYLPVYIWQAVNHSWN